MTGVIDALRGLCEDSPVTTGLLSSLDEATVEFRDNGGGLGEAQRAFSAARMRHMDSFKPGRAGDAREAWSAVVRTARDLADALEAS